MSELVSPAETVAPQADLSLAAVVIASGAATAALLAVAGLIGADAVPMALAAILLHALAVWLAVRATQAARASRSEMLLFAAVAAALPGVGAFAALWFCTSGAPRHASNAHAENDPLLLETIRSHTDLQRELGVNSYTQVVRHGSLEEKRNLIRRLAQLGTARHVAIVRQFLFEEEPELRLCAYAELARIGQRHEKTIGELRCTAEEPPNGEPVAEAFAALATANRAYAISGVLDKEMTGYWWEQAELIARHSIEIDQACSAAQRVLALVLADRGWLDEAWQIIAAWPTEFDKDAELVRAEVAFRRHNRRECSASLARLEAANEPTPEWLRTIVHAEAVL